MRIGQVAEATGVTVEALRFYERRGLLPTPARTSGGYRDYPLEAVAVVRFIRHVQQLGFSLDDIDGMLHLAAGGPDDCDAVRDLAEAKIDQISQKIAYLTAMRAALGQLVGTCQRPRPDRRCPLLAEVLPASAS
ncbi:MerR family transcriptional regulator [Micromonospora sp. HM5-17]|uniref:MerR family transcriptional regulator n=1 Tax=Micromonospora sp. HM5-17 TaxID=2487710 RepID=UPI000F47041B|nr:MerR family transcriptional regulator [Micromonospora sp. HM5-17]ROT33447.1 MerR family DNA-binding transcriptional regulator [Micromonospora sp. HM5-17]